MTNIVAVRLKSGKIEKVDSFIVDHDSVNIINRQKESVIKLCKNNIAKQIDSVFYGDHNCAMELKVIGSSAHQYKSNLLGIAVAPYTVHGLFASNKMLIQVNYYDQKIVDSTLVNVFPNLIKVLGHTLANNTIIHDSGTVYGVIGTETNLTLNNEKLFIGDIVKVHRVSPLFGNVSSYCTVVETGEGQFLMGWQSLSVNENFKKFTSDYVCEKVESWKTLNEHHDYYKKAYKNFSIIKAKSDVN